MSDVPTASTSTASTSSASLASTSQTNPYTFRLTTHDLDMDFTTTDDSEISSDEESEILDEESSNTNEVGGAGEASDDRDDSSWSSASSSVASCGGKSTSENSENEKSILKELLNDEKYAEDKLDDPLTPILILVQPPCETDGEMNEIGIDMINVEEHGKRLRELETELDYIESTEWKYRPIDSSIR